MHIIRSEAMLVSCVHGALSVLFILAGAILAWYAYTSLIRTKFWQMRILGVVLVPVALLWAFVGFYGLTLIPSVFRAWS